MNTHLNKYTIKVLLLLFFLVTENFTQRVARRQAYSATNFTAIKLLRAIDPTHQNQLSGNPGAFTPDGAKQIKVLVYYSQ